MRTALICLLAVGCSQPDEIFCDGGGFDDDPELHVEWDVPSGTDLMDVSVDARSVSADCWQELDPSSGGLDLTIYSVDQLGTVTIFGTVRTRGGDLRPVCLMPDDIVGSAKARFDGDRIDYTIGTLSEGGGKLSNSCNIVFNLHNTVTETEEE